MESVHAKTLGGFQVQKIRSCRVLWAVKSHKNCLKFSPKIRKNPNYRSIKDFIQFARNPFRPFFCSTVAKRFCEQCRPALDRECRSWSRRTPAPRWRRTFCCSTSRRTPASDGTRTVRRPTSTKASTHGPARRERSTRTGSWYATTWTCRGEFSRATQVVRLYCDANRALMSHSPPPAGQTNSHEKRNFLVK